MSANQQAQSKSITRTALTLIYRIIIVLLIIGIILSAIQVVNVWLGNLSQDNLTASRQADYEGTATAYATPLDDADSGYFHFAQFATNTPIAALFPTNPPEQEATAIPPTDMPVATQAPVRPTEIPKPTFFGVQDAALETISGTAVPPRASVVPREDELVNIVLLGSDGDIVGDNTIRTDTIVIVSINTRTQTVSMLNLTRDLFVYVPTPTMARINTVYGIGESIGWSGGGFGLLRETIFYNFGIQVHYHAFVEISGLVEIIDTVGGVDVAVD